MTLISYNKLMRILKKIKYYLGEIFILSGICLSTYNALNFSHRTFNIFHRLSTQNVSYYYDSNSTSLITVGIFLISLGIIIMYNRKHGK
jgi:hypothetical protein